MGVGVGQFNVFMTHHYKMVLTLQELQNKMGVWLSSNKKKRICLLFQQGNEGWKYYLVLKGEPFRKKIHVFFEKPKTRENEQSCLQLQYFEKEGKKYLRLDDYYFNINKDENPLSIRNKCPVMDHTLMFKVLNWLALIFSCDILTLNDEATKRTEQCNWDLGLFQKLVRGNSFYEKFGFEYSSPLLKNVASNPQLNEPIQKHIQLFDEPLQQWLKKNVVENGDQQGKRFEELTVKQLVEVISQICMKTQTTTEWDKYTIYNELRWVIYALLFQEHVSNHEEVLECCFGTIPVDTTMEKTVVLPEKKYTLELKENPNDLYDNIILHILGNTNRSRSALLPFKKRTRRQTGGKKPRRSCKTNRA